MLTIEGNIVNSAKVFRGRIEIDESGIINKIGEPTGDADFIFKDELIFPGFIDVHVHAREDMSHTQDYKEDFQTAGEAAINGGVVAFADMPNNPVPPTDDTSYENKNNLTRKSAVPILLYAGIGQNTKPLNKKVPYKVFTSKSVGEIFINSKEQLETVIKNYQGQNVSFHCEDSEIIEQNKNEPTHEKQRPREAEVKAIDFVLDLIETYKIKGKICHLSTKEGLNKIIEAKKQGLNVTCEVAPHHLYFDETILNEKNRKMFQVNPPLRTEEDRLALIAGLKNGAIDYLATDHAPHTLEEKEKGISGLPQLDTYGPFAAWLIKEHNFTAEDIGRVCSQNPATFMNQFVKEPYGKIEKGFVGSLTILALNKQILITKEILKTKNKWSPFLGITFPGSVVMTVIRGQIYGK